MDKNNSERPAHVCQSCCAPIGHHIVLNFLFSNSPDMSQVCDGLMLFQNRLQENASVLLLFVNWKSCQCSKARQSVLVKNACVMALSWCSSSSMESNLVCTFRHVAWSNPAHNRGRGWYGILMAPHREYAQRNRLLHVCIGWYSSAAYYFQLECWMKTLFWVLTDFVLKPLADRRRRSESLAASLDLGLVILSWKPSGPKICWYLWLWNNHHSKCQVFSYCLVAPKNYDSQCKLHTSSRNFRNDPSVDHHIGHRSNG